MYNIVSNPAVVAQAYSFSGLAQNVTKINDPINASFTATKLIIINCLPPKIKYPAKCLVFFIQVGIGIWTRDATSVALSIGSGKQLLEEFL